MEILVNHLTRMRGGHVCVAGLDRDGHHIRPVLDRERLRKELTGDYGGAFRVGAVVEIGPTRPRPTPPEVEDHVFDAAAVQMTRMADPAKFWRFLDELSRPLLRNIFGDTLSRDGRTASTPVDTGIASLGIYRPHSRVSVDRSYGKLRIVTTDEALGRMSLPLTDLRLYDLEAEVVDDRRVEVLEDRLRRRDVLLSVGVGRPWSPEDEEPRHWLQVNNVHLDDNPLWPE